MMLKIKFLFLFLGLLIPYLLIYQVFFSQSPLSFGDAPYYYPENLKELFDQPLAWNFRNDNFGNSQFHILWIFIPTFLFGLLDRLWGLNSEILIRLIFYFPATILALVGAWFFIKLYVKNELAIFLGTLIYGFSNHFLLLIDGGQVGVALAYGIFPFALIGLRKFTNQTNLRNFLLALLVLAILSNIDLRIAILSWFVFLILLIFESINNFKILFKKVKFLLLFPILLIPLNAFWIFPLLNFLKNGSIDNFQLPISSVNFISIINGLFLFNPHFPKNEFGVIQSVPFYFGLVPLFVFGNLLFKTNKVSLGLSATLLIMIFFSKGANEPLGQIYSWFLDNVPLASSFRDSSKFFFPIWLLSATLISLTLEMILNYIKENIKLFLTILIGLYCYFLFLISPALSGNLTGNLSAKTFDNNYLLIYKKIKETLPFFRTLWFPEKPSLAFTTQEKEALNANLLYKDWPFAAMIRGDYELFNFIYDPMVSDWLRLLGIKYTFFPVDERKKSWTEPELLDRQILLESINKLPFLQKLDWGINIPVYQVSNTLPKIFTQSKALIIVGDQNIYERLKTEEQNFSLVNQGFIFLEDGISDPDTLFNLPPEAASLIFLDRNQNDLPMIFLQNKFLDRNKLTQSAWGKYLPNQYLQLKYELLKQDIDIKDFGFNRGAIFSSITGEKATYKTGPIQKGEYLLAFRMISASNSAGIKVSFNNQSYFINNVGKQFTWNILGPFSFSEGDVSLSLENLGGFHALNVISIFTKQDWDEAEKKAKQLITHFPNYNFNDKSDINNLTALLKAFKIEKIPYQEVSPIFYEINLTNKKPSWLVFSDHFDHLWEIDSKQMNITYPLYSMINGFWIDKEEDGYFSLNYKVQKLVNIGIIVSIISTIILLISTCIAFIFKK